MTEENPRKVSVTEERALLEGKVRKRANISSKELVRIRLVIIGIFLYVKITSLNRDANSAINVCLDTLRLMGSAVKKSKKGGKVSVALLEASFQLRYVSQDTEPPKKSYATEK